MKPILFNTEMVRAILDGRKTQTRRVIKPQPTNPRWNNVGWLGWDDGHGYRMKPPCKPGDVLWVRETWQHVYTYDDSDKAIEETGRYVYFADDPMPFTYWVDTDTGEHKDQMPWRPSIHMPRDAARIFLRVNDVQVERLNEISQSDAIDEGALTCDLCETDEYKESCEKAKREGSKPPIGYSPRERFAALWDSTIKNTEITKYGWVANPWVWVIKFERCERPDSITFISTMLS